MQHPPGGKDLLRPFAKYDATSTTAVTKMDITKMKDGDIAGLAVFQDPYACIAVKQTNESKYIIMVNNGKIIDSVSINKPIVYLRTIASNVSKKAKFEYSIDGKNLHILHLKKQILLQGEVSDKKNKWQYHKNPEAGSTGQAVFKNPVAADLTKAVTEADSFLAKKLNIALTTLSGFHR